MISLIVATDINGAIAIKGENTLPWNCPSDLEYFKKVTEGNVVIMGDNTWFSLPEKFRPLPGRVNIVLTNNKDRFTDDDNCFAITTSIEESIGMAKYWIREIGVKFETETKKTEIIVMGGVSVYKQFMDMNLVDRVYINVLNREIKKPKKDLLYFDFLQEEFEEKLEENWIMMLFEEHEDFTSYVYESRKYTEERIRG